MTAPVPPNTDQPRIAYRYTGDYLGDNPRGFGKLLQRLTLSKEQRAARNSDIIGRGFDGKLYVDIGGTWYDIPGSKLNEIQLPDGAVDKTYTYDNIDLTGDGKQDSVRSTIYMHTGSGSYDISIDTTGQAEKTGMYRTLQYVDHDGAQQRYFPIKASVNAKQRGD